MTRPPAMRSSRRLAGDPRVFTIASYTKTSIDKGPNDLRDKRLLTADFDKISQVQLDRQEAVDRIWTQQGRVADSEAPAAPRG